jgi:putative ABC transport system permease protein
MPVLKLIFRNLLRHKLRTSLTIMGIAVAVMSYALLRTVLDTWYLSLDMTSPNRLIVRNSASFVFPLPQHYMSRIATVPGVTAVTHATWFGGRYIDDKSFFSRIAVDPATFLDMYSEYTVPAAQYAEFKQYRNAAIVGAKTSKQFNIKPGDVITVEGDIFPGNWEFHIVGIYRGLRPTSDETNMFFHWDYINEGLLKTAPGRAGQVGWYVVRIANPDQAPAISATIDAMFKNSPYETKTETEKAFTLGFISMMSTILTALEFISYIIIGIIFLVLANTMVMTARERIVEYAVLKTLGFRALHLVGLIVGESLLISVLGAGCGILITYPIVGGIAQMLSNFFPVFNITANTLFTAASFALLIGICASIVPLQRALTTRIVDGLRHVG